MEPVSIGSALTTVDTTAKFPLGMTVTVPAKGTTDATSTARNTGEVQWIYVYNDSGVAFAAGGVCVNKDSETKYHVRLSEQSAPEHPCRVVGVAQHAIATASYGWIVRRGYANVRADTGGLTAGLGLIVGNAVDGTADDAAAITGAVFGFTITAAAATALAVCRVDCRG